MCMPCKFNNGLFAVPSPSVSLFPPPSSLIAGTPHTLTCSIAVNSAVDVDVMVDVTWAVTTDTDPILTNSTATGSVPAFTDTLDIPILSTHYTGAICRARVRQSSPSAFIVDSSEESSTINFTVQGFNATELCKMLLCIIAMWPLLQAKFTTLIAINLYGLSAYKLW